MTLPRRPVIGRGKPVFAAVKCVVFDHLGRVLVLWKREPRLFRSHAPIEHDLPGGRVEPSDESHEAAARREALEETGLMLDVLGPVRTWRFEREKDVLSGTTFICRRKAGRVKLSEELHHHEWRDPNKLADAPEWLREDVKSALDLYKKHILPKG